MSRLLDAIARGRRQTTLANSDHIDFLFFFLHDSLLNRLFIKLSKIAFGTSTINYKLITILNAKNDTHYLNIQNVVSPHLNF